MIPGKGCGWVGETPPAAHQGPLVKCLRHRRCPPEEDQVACQPQGRGLAVRPGGVWTLPGTPALSLEPRGKPAAYQGALVSWTPKSHHGSVCVPRPLVLFVLIASAIGLLASHFFVAPGPQAVFWFLPGELAFRLLWVALATVWLFFFSALVWRREEPSEDAEGGES